MRNQFFWYDLVTTDTAAAAKFYGAVVGWSYQDMSQPGMAMCAEHDQIEIFGLSGMNYLKERRSYFKHSACLHARVAHPGAGLFQDHQRH